jgi:hypothetical protein
MPTTDERIILLEERLARLDEAINGGDSVPWERSVRGRLHTVSDQVNAARIAQQALAEVRANQRRSWSRAQRWAALAVAAAAAAAPYLLHFFG